MTASSRRRRPRTGRHTPPRSALVDIGRASAEARGCVCEREYHLTHLAPGVTYLAVAHDDWCPAVQRAR